MKCSYRDKGKSNNTEDGDGGGGFTLYARRDREEAGGGFGGPAPISKPTPKERTLDSVAAGSC
jgi:hypothetical protein